MKFNNCDLAYRSPISREKAVELGEYLVQEKFCSGTHKISAEITGALNKVQFRFVVKEGYENRAKYIKIVRLFSGMIARAVFPDSNFEIHLCDSKMNTLRVIKH